MIVQQTLTQLRAMKLDGMAAILEEQMNLPTSATLSFEDRMALLVQGESAYRDNRRLTRLLAKAKLKYAQACLEDLDTRHNRGLDTRLVATLSHGQWINHAQTLLIWPDRRRKDVAGLRVRAEGVSTWKERALRARAAPA